MNAPRALAFLLLLSLPLASAGGIDVSVRYLESDTECSSDSRSGSYSGNHTFPDGTRLTYTQDYMTGEQRCSTDVDTLSIGASHDGAALASARVGGEDDSTSREDWYHGSMTQTGPAGSYEQSQTGTQWTRTADERRGVDASAAGQEAFAGRACEDSWTYGWSSGGSSSSSGASTSSSGSNEGSEYGCRTGATTSAGAAGLDSACGYQHASSSTNFGYGSRQDTSDSSECFTGVRGEAAGESFTAGDSASCQGSAQRESYPGESYSSSWHQCRGGLVVNAPGDTTLFVGQVTYGSDWCHDVDCSTYSWQMVGFSLGSPHSPLGGNPIGFYYPLP